VMETPKNRECDNGVQWSGPAPEGALERQPRYEVGRKRKASRCGRWKCLLISVTGAAII
jgi:hypothetical protein